METERGLNLSIQAVPREGAGRTIQLVSDLRGTGEEAGAWETSTPYESLLVTISQAVRGGKLPAGWYQVPVTKETLQAPAGLSSVADSVWTGNHLKMVRFVVENKTLSALNIRESDFWQPGTRAVMFSQPASQLLVAPRTKLGNYLQIRFQPQQLRKAGADDEVIVYKGNGDHDWVLADKKRAYLNDKRDVVQVGYGVCIGLMMLSLSSKRLPER